MTSRSCLVLAVLVLIASPALSADPASEAMAWFNAGQYDKAASLFADPGWRGAALYRAGRYRMAAEAFREAGDAESLYNLGNAHARMAEYGEAIKAYDQALVADPSHADAKANREVIRVLMEVASKSSEPSGKGAQATALDSRAETHRKSDDLADLDQASYGEIGRAGVTPSGELSEQPGSATPPESQNLPDTGTPRDRDKTAGLAADTGGLGSQDSGQAPPPTDALGKPREKPKVPTFEDKQASIEWLASIRDDTERFLRMRLVHELAQREAAGTAVPAGADPW